MQELFASALTPIGVIYSLIQHRYGSSQVMVAHDIATDQLARSITRVVLVQQYQTLKRYWPVLYKKPVIVVVFDSPVALQPLNHFIPLDFKQLRWHDVLQHNFTETTVNFAVLFAAIEQPSRQIKLRQHNKVLLPELISWRANGQFIELVNTLRYSTPISTKRKQLAVVIVKAVVGRISLAKLQTQLTKSLPTNAGRQKTISDIIRYLKSQKGKILQQALQESIATNKPNFTTAAEQYRGYATDLRQLWYWWQASL